MIDREKWRRFILSSVSDLTDRELVLVTIALVAYDCIGFTMYDCLLYSSFAV